MKLFNSGIYQDWFLRLYQQGLTNKEIANEMSVSVPTINSHCKAAGLTPNGGSGRGGYRTNNTTRRHKHHGCKVQAVLT